MRTTRINTQPKFEHNLDLDPQCSTTSALWNGRSALIISFPRWENLSQTQHYFSSRPLNSLTPATSLSSSFLFNRIGEQRCRGLLGLLLDSSCASHVAHRRPSATQNTNSPSWRSNIRPRNCASLSDYSGRVHILLQADHHTHLLRRSSISNLDRAHATLLRFFSTYNSTWSC